MADAEQKTLEKYFGCTVPAPAAQGFAAEPFRALPHRHDRDDPSSASLFPAPRPPPVAAAFLRTARLPAPQQKTSRYPRPLIIALSFLLFALCSLLFALCLLLFIAFCSQSYRCHCIAITIAVVVIVVVVVVVVVAAADAADADAVAESPCRRLPFAFAFVLVCRPRRRHLIFSSSSLPF